MSPRRDDAARVLAHLDAVRAGLYAAHAHVDVDDLVAEVVLRACEHSEALPADDDALRGWLFVTARQLGRSRVARKRVEVRYEIRRDVRTLDPLPRIEAREDLRRVVGRFNRSERALMAAVARGDTTAEIAAETGTPVGSVATRVRRIRKHLRR